MRRRSPRERVKELRDNARPATLVRSASGEPKVRRVAEAAHRAGSVAKAFGLLASTLALVVGSGVARADDALKKSEGAEIDWSGLYGGLAFGVAIPPTNGEHFIAITGRAFARL